MFAGFIGSDGPLPLVLTAVFGTVFYCLGAVADEALARRRRVRRAATPPADSATGMTGRQGPTGP